MLAAVQVLVNLTAVKLFTGLIASSSSSFLDELQDKSELLHGSSRNLHRRSHSSFKTANDMAMEKKKDVLHRVLNSLGCIEVRTFLIC